MPRCGHKRYAAHGGLGPPGALLAHADPVRARPADVQILVTDVGGGMGADAVRWLRRAGDPGGAARDRTDALDVAPVAARGRAWEPHRRARSEERRVGKEC